MEGLRWSEAAQLVAHAIEQGREAGLSVAVAIVDGGRELKAFGRDDDAMLVTTQLAIGKAYTACSLRRSTLELNERTWSGSDLHGLETAHDPPLVCIGGGVPLRRDEAVVGAIGVSGGKATQDHELAVAAAELYANGLQEAS